MGQVIGDLLALAVGVAISPVPIIAVILMLLAPRAGRTSIGFLVGWIAGIVVAVVIFTLVARATNLGDPSDPSAGAAWVRLVLGLALIAFGVRQWLRRPPPDGPAPLPGWMAAVDKTTPVKAVGLGFVLAAVNPKNLVLGVTAGVAIAAGQLDAGGTTVAVLLYTALAASTVAVPVLAYSAATERMSGPLDRLKGWLQENNVAVMSVLFLVLGAVLTGKGISGVF